MSADFSYEHGSSERRRRYPLAKVKGGWSHDEDVVLRKLVEELGEGNWSIIARQLNATLGKSNDSGRIGKQCRERYNHHLRPDIKKDAWTEAEEAQLVWAHSRYGNRWSDIAKVIQGRSENSVKNHWNATLRRKDTDKCARGGSNPPHSCVLRDYMIRINLLPGTPSAAAMASGAVALLPPLPGRSAASRAAAAGKRRARARESSESQGEEELEEDLVPGAMAAPKATPAVASASPSSSSSTQAGLAAGMAFAFAGSDGGSASGALPAPAAPLLPAAPDAPAAAAARKRPRIITFAAVPRAIMAAPEAAAAGVRPHLVPGWASDSAEESHVNCSPVAERWLPANDSTSEPQPLLAPDHRQQEAAVAVQEAAAGFSGRSTMGVMTIDAEGDGAGCREVQAAQIMLALRALAGGIVM